MHFEPGAARREASSTARARPSATGPMRRANASTSSWSDASSLSSASRALAAANTTHNAADSFDSVASDDGMFGGWQENHASLGGDLVLITQYLWATTRREWKTWATGVFTVALVVFFVALLQNSIERSPIIFWRLSELSVGEIDMQLVSKANPAAETTDESVLASGLPLINFTHVAEQLADVPLVAFTVPRWYALGRVRPRDVSSRVSSTIIVLADTEHEAAVGMGRAWDHRPLGESEVHMSAALLRSLGLRAQAGDRAVVSLESAQLASLLGLDQDELFDALGPVGALFGTTTTTDGAPVANVTGATVDPVDTVQSLFPLLDAAGVNTSALTPDVLAALFGAGNVTLPSVLLGANGLGTLVLDTLTQGGLFRVETDSNGTVTNVALDLEVAVVDAIASAGGMYPDALGNVAMMDVRHLEALLRRQFSVLAANALLVAFAPAAADALAQLAGALGDGALDAYALSVIISYRDRERAYMLTGDAQRGHMTRFTDAVFDRLGFNSSLDASLPVHTALAGTEIIRLFLDQIFNAVVVVLTVLSSLLIYSLMLSNVEEKTYEYGMLRALGMRQRSLLVLLVLQALSFALPGISIGWTLAVVIDVPVAVLLARFADLDPTFGLSWWPLTLTLLLGLLMPLAANYIPIRRALAKNLRSALDVYHQTSSETTVTVQRLESLGLSPWQTALALILIVIGFITYYLIPYSFIFGNLALFLTILTGILLGIVLGLALIAQVAQPYAEAAVLRSVLWGRDRRLFSLVRKNLAGHRARNRKTALMFTVSLAFLIFAGALFALQQRLIADLIGNFLGSDVVVTSLQWELTLDEPALREYLDSQGGSLVSSFSFITGTLDESELVDKSTVSTIVNFPRVGQFFYGVDQNFLSTAYVKYVAITEVDKSLDYARTSNGLDDVTDSLYRHAGQARLSIDRGARVVPPVLVTGPRFVSAAPDVATELDSAYRTYYDCIVGEALRDRVSVSQDTPLAITLRYKVTESTDLGLLKLGKIRAMVSKFPGFFFSSYRQFASFTPILVRHSSFSEALDRAYNISTIRSELPRPSIAASPKSSLLVRMAGSKNTADRETLINGMRNFIANDQIQVVDVLGLIASTSVALDMIQLFFVVVAVLTSVLCFFVLLLSFTANIRENAWEFGVLRAVGLSAAQAFRVYLYEAATLVAASSVMGTVIGLVTACTLTLQMGLFTESPFQFDFPLALFLACVGLSVAVTVFGSWLPARSIMRKEIAIAIKDAG